MLLMTLLTMLYFSLNAISYMINYQETCELS